MSARRFFVSGVRAVGERVKIDGSDAHKIAHVLRLGNGDHIEVIDSAGSTFDAAIEAAPGYVEATLRERRASDSRSDLQVDVAQGLPKGQKMDYIVEKLTELGVSTIFPLVSERAVARDASSAKLDRWRRLVRAAAQQSGRTIVPTVSEPLSYHEIFDRVPEYDLVVFAWESASGPALRDELPGWLKGVRRMLVIVGPEGGLSHGEAEAAQSAGARIVSLGSRILRTETAGLVVMAILGFLVDL
jgi:16S rRNA (uracil1498-N3)-methyltransferase